MRTNGQGYSNFKNEYNAMGKNSSIPSKYLSIIFKDLANNGNRNRNQLPIKPSTVKNNINYKYNMAIGARPAGTTPNNYGMPRPGKKIK